MYSKYPRSCSETSTVATFNTTGCVAAARLLRLSGLYWIGRWFLSAASLMNRSVKDYVRTGFGLNTCSVIIRRIIGYKTFEDFTNFQTYFNKITRHGPTDVVSFLCSVMLFMLLNKEGNSSCHNSPGRVVWNGLQLQSIVKIIAWFPASV